MIAVMDQYYQKITGILSSIYQTQGEKIQEAAGKVAKTIKEDGIVHIFGCGHSHLICEEVFYRAGGLVPINAILDPGLMLHEGAAKSSKLERLTGYATLLMDNYNVQPGDLLIVISNSGINSVPIEMALCGREQKVEVVAITSSCYFNEKSRHSSGKHLYEVSDLYIDSLVERGDATLELGTFLRVGPSSTMAATFIINSIMVQAAENLTKLGIWPPVFASNNVPGGEAHNKKYLQKYKARLKHL
jgi:uncharacterized phosphosugar-binding protein